MLDEKCTSDHVLIYRILREMHFMPEGNISHFILIAPTKKNIMPQKIAFQILGTTKLHLGSQDPGSRKFSCPGEDRQLDLEESDQVVMDNDKIRRRGL